MNPDDGNHQPLRLTRLFSSLRFKTTLALVGALVFVLGVTSVLRYERHRDQEMNSAQAQAAFTSDVIQASLQDVMQTQDLTDVRAIVDQIGRQPGITTLDVIDASDQIRFSSKPSNVGKSFDRLDPSFGACASLGSPQPSSIVYTNAAGEQILRYCRPIANQPACYTCHASTQRILGMLVSDYSLVATNQFINTDLLDTFLFGFASLVVGVVVIQFLLNHFAFGKLGRFASILQRFGQGDLAARLPFHGDDEIEQLAASFNQMADGLQIRDKENARLYRELQAKDTALTQLLQEIIGNQEEDRKRLSRGLHDDFSQSLTALSMTLQTALQKIPPGNSSLRDELERFQALTTDTLAEASRWIQDLRPRLLDDMGLVPAIRAYVESRLDNSDAVVKIEAHELEGRLPTEIETTLFRIIQEAVSNIAKHAHAHHVFIRIDHYPSGHLVARIEDDGVGFIPGKYLHSPDGLRGVGLLSMRERVALLGGTLMIDSTPGRGTIVRAEVPWKTNSNPSGS